MADAHTALLAPNRVDRQAQNTVAHGRRRAIRVCDSAGRVLAQAHEGGAGLHGAVLPLWQLAQLVAWLNLLWSTLALFQEVVLWQFSQVVTPAWVPSAGLPRAAR